MAGRLIDGLPILWDSIEYVLSDSQRQETSKTYCGYLIKDIEIIQEQLCAFISARSYKCACLDMIFTSGEIPLSLVNIEEVRQRYPKVIWNVIVEPVSLRLFIKSKNPSKFITRNELKLVGNCLVTRMDVSASGSYVDFMPSYYNRRNSHACYQLKMNISSSIFLKSAKHFVKATRMSVFS